MLTHLFVKFRQCCPHRLISSPVRAEARNAKTISGFWRKYEPDSGELQEARGELRPGQCGQICKERECPPQAGVSPVRRGQARKSCPIFFPSILPATRRLAVR